MKFKTLTAAGLLVSVFGSAAYADMSVKLGGGWDGKKIPAGQHCPLQGGKGKTPPMSVSGIPNGTTWIFVEYNDRDYKPLSTNGGHGIIGFPVKGASANLPAVPGMTGRLPGNARVIQAARGTGDYASDGYKPPCSGGRNHRYFAIVKAVSAQGKVLDKTRVEIGRY